MARSSIWKIRFPSCQPIAPRCSNWAVLGQIRAFAHVAGRCTAAQAGFIKKVRDQKTYKKLCSDWRQFCPEYLNISGAQADKIIALLDEFGPEIFDLKQLMNIAPETYRIVEQPRRTERLSP